MKRNLIFLGPPGAGKGTFATMLKEKEHLAHISTGEIFRNEIKNQTELGKTAKKYVESGGLVPDEIVAAMVSKRLGEPDCDNGFILDGFPRTIKQAELLKKALAEKNSKIDAAILFEADDELLLKRLTARMSCPKCGKDYNKLFSPPKNKWFCDDCEVELTQRKDDTLETAKSRLNLYKKETAPLVEFYKKENLLCSVNSDGEKPAVLKELQKVIKE
ncbi:MAG: adenylate kinase [Victivallales bacterium]|nr:adenylate kinase [Victivallales bacterium]